jgi:hypothetical protein
VTLVLTAAVLGFVGFRLAGAARHSLGPGRWLAGQVVAGIRWRHVWPVPFVLAGVVVAALALVQLPLLAWGWWSALGGEGNPVFASTDQTAGTWLAWFVPAVFLVLLTPAIPLLALREEQVFRRGAESWSWPKRAGLCLVFGLAHAAIGIPLGVALALAIGGAYFMAVYLRAWRASGGSTVAACLASASAHTAYNWSIVGLVVVALLADAVMATG